MKVSNPSFKVGRLIAEKVQLQVKFYKIIEKSLKRISLKMGSFLSRQLNNAVVEDADNSANNLKYKYPPKTGM